MKRACMKLIRSALPVLVICWMASSASATRAVMLSDRDLALDSRVIVTGEIASVISAWDDTERVPFTYVEVQVDQILKGELSTGRVVLKQIGGTYGSGGMRVLGQPVFSSGQRVMLYLNAAPDGSLHVAHSFMGMFTIAQDSITGRDTVTRWDASAEVDISALQTVERMTNRAPLDEYLAGVAETLRNEAVEVARIESERRSRPVVAIPSEYKRVKRTAAGFSPSFAFIAGGVRWMEADSGQPITYFVNPANSPISGGGSAELARAMSAWSTQTGANVRLQVGGQTSRCGWEGDGSNTISFGDCRNQLDPAVGCSGVVAATSVSYTQESRVVGGRTFNRIVESDVVFNRGMDCFLGTSANLAEVACHELGHSIGLDHSSDPAAIMYYAAHGRGFDARPKADDIAGVLAIYPSAGIPPAPPGGGPNDASFVTQTAPTIMTVSQSYTVYVTLRNAGSSTWLPGAGYKLGAQNPTDNFTWGLNRVNLPGPVAPATDVTFAFNVTAPAVAGSYNFQWRMLQDGVGYFGPLSPNISINVSGGGGGGQGPVSITSNTLTEGKTGRAYKQQLDALGGLQPYHWSLISGALPPGLGLSTNGVILGTPTQTGDYDFGVQVFDFTSSIDKSDSRRFRITVTDPAALPTPTVSRVKVKASKKLFVYGANFSESSLIQLNGVLLTPKSVEIEGISGTISYKGHLTLLPAGNNVVVVLNGAQRSAGFFF